MKGDDREIVTQDIMHMLDDDDGLSRVLNSKRAVTNPDVVTYLDFLLREHKLNIADVVISSQMSKSYIYQVFSGSRVPGRDVLIRIAFAMDLDLGETQRLLQIAQRGVLYPRVRRDTAIIYCLKHDKDIYDADELLISLGEQPLL